MFHLDTTVTIFQLIFIILILSLLSSAFGLLISSSVKEMQSASMLGVMINIITTLFAGSFFTVSNNNLITKIGSLLPQKHILDFTIALENNDVITYGNVASVIAITIIMIFCSFLINKYNPIRKIDIDIQTINHTYVVNNRNQKYFRFLVEILTTNKLSS
ncbi:ABC-type multidrug transport system permease subunit [Clostridium saccharobutylicum]|nr:ABC-type multidrug transport system permease subunit [Clostridium saccharobutylicum]